MENEKRLIDANALKLEAWPERYTGEGIVYVEDIDNAPTVDAVEVVHAWWEVVEPKRFPNLTAKIRCSACKKEPKKHSYEESGFGYSYTIDSWHATDYCPNCGAKMDGVADKC